MSRGMVVDEDAGNIRPTGVGQSIVRTFSTDLPNHDFSQQIKAGKQLQEIGEDMWRDASIQGAKKAAEEAKIEIGPDGKYRKPESSWLMGIKGGQVYDKVLEDRFIEHVYRDAEGELNEIASKHFNDPETSGRLMSESIANRLGMIPDEGLKNRLAPIFQREFSERQRSILNTRSRQDYGNVVEDAKLSAQDYESKAFDALLAGDTARATEMQTLAEGAVDRLVELGDVSPEAKARQAERLQMQADGVKVLQEVEKLRKAGTLTREDFDIAKNLLNGTAGDDIEWRGFTQKRVLERLSPRMRDVIRQKLGRQEDSYLQEVTTRAGQATAGANGSAATVDFVDTFRRSGPTGHFPHDWSGPEIRSRTEAYLNSLGPLTPEQQVSHLHALTGTVPKELYKPMFENAESRSPQRLMELSRTYKAMEALQTRDGRPAGVAGQVLDGRDAAFMFHFSRAYEGAVGDPEARATEAARAATNLLKEGLDTVNKAQEPEQMLARFRSQASGRDVKPAEIVKEIRDGLPNGDKLTADQTRWIVHEAATRVALTNGRKDHAAAVAEAQARFQATHDHSDLVAVGGRPGGWVHKDFAIPKIPVAGGSSDAYMRAYGQGLLDLNKDGSTSTSEKWEKQGAVDVKIVEPKDPLIKRKVGETPIVNPKIGENVFLVPTGKSTGAGKEFHMIYRTPDGVPVPLVDDRNLPVTVSTEKPFLKQSQESAQQLKATSEARNQVVDTWIPGGPPPGRDEVLAPEMPAYTEVPGRVDPRDALVTRPAPPVEGNPPVTTEPPRPRGGGGRQLRPPVRRDGMPDPFTAGQNRAALEGSEDTVQLAGGTSIQGISRDEFQTLADQRRDRNPGRFAVTNREGPRAGETVTINGTFAKRLATMIEDMPEDVRQGFALGSVVRSYDEQVDVKLDAIRRGRPRYAATPGRSRHELGEAADLQMSLKARAWTHANAKKYGLHFPMSYEPWHIEPIEGRGRVGKGHSHKHDKHAAHDEGDSPFQEA